MMARFIKQRKSKSRVATLGLLGMSLLSRAVGAQGTPPVAAPSQEFLPLLSGKQGANQWFASTDPKHGNDDYLLLKAGETRTVLLPQGRLLRLWSTALRPDKLRLVLTTEGWRMPGSARTPAFLLDNNRAQFGTLYQKAFTLYPTLRWTERVRELGQGAALTFTNQDTQPNKVFYQVTVGPQNVAKTTDLPSVGMGNSEYPNLNLAPGEAKQLTQIAGAGSIKRIVVTLGASGSDALLTTRLRIKWDNKQAAQGGNSAFDVDVPLAAFVAGFQTPQPTQNAMAQLTGKQLSINWIMPFASGVSVSLLNAGEKPFTGGLKIEADSTKTAASPYCFHAVTGSALSQKGQPISMLQLKGSGLFCGLALDMRPSSDSSARSFAYLEGNETITADGKHYEGTGTEDFFNSAWYFPDKPFAQPYAGMTYKSATPPHVSAYRLMIPDVVPFKQQLSFDFEHGSGNNRNDIEYRWAAFWYQAPGGTAAVPDTLGGSTSSSATGTPASGAAHTDGKFLLIVFGVVMGAVGLFLVRRNVRRNSR